MATIDSLFKTADLVGRATFIFAKTMPHNPHYYTARKSWDRPDEFEFVVRTIRAYGMPRIYDGKPYVELSLNGYYYWTMGAAPSATIVINRKRRRYGHALRRDRHLLRQRLLGSNASSGGCRGQTGNWRSRGQANPRPWNAAPEALSTSFLRSSPEMYTGIDPSEMMLREFAGKHPGFRHRTTACTMGDCWPRGRCDVITGLFGVGAFVTETDVVKLKNMLTPGGSWFLMAFAEKVKPELYHVFRVTEQYEDEANACLEEASDEVREIGYHRLYIGRRKK